MPPCLCVCLPRPSPLSPHLPPDHCSDVCVLPTLLTCMCAPSNLPPPPLPPQITAIACVCPETWQLCGVSMLLAGWEVEEWAFSGWQAWVEDGWVRVGGGRVGESGWRTGG